MEEPEEPNVRHYRHLLRNYRTLLAIIKAQPQDPAASGTHPGLEGFLQLRNIEKAFDQKPPQDPLAEILKLDDHHPFFRIKRKEYFLRRMYLGGRFADFVSYYDNSRQNVQLQAWRVNALLKTGRPDEALEDFKRLLAQSRDGKLREQFTSLDWQRLTGRLGEDFWRDRFRRLVRLEDFSELIREFPLANRFPQLALLFKAELAYQRRRYEECRRLVLQLKNPAYRLLGERLLLKIGLRQGDRQQVAARIERFRNEPDIYREVLLDSAGLLLVSGEEEEAIGLFQKYVRSSTDQDENRWKALWIMAWLSLRRHQKREAIAHFAAGSSSPYFGYRVACQYWASKLDARTDSKLPPYPISYYSMKTYGAALFATENREHSLSTLNQAPSQLFEETAALIVTMLRQNALEESLEVVEWTEQTPGLRRIDQKMLAIIKSILLFKRNDFFRTYTNFKNNIAADVTGNFPFFLSRIFYPVSYRQLVSRYSRDYQVEPMLIMAIIREESFFQADAVSSARALGVMQLLFTTAKTVARENHISIKRSDLFNPEINIRLGIHHFKSLLDKYGGRIHLALAAYNAGDARVDQWLREFGGFGEEEFIEMIPISQTRNYVKNILLNHLLYTYYHEKS